VASFNQRFGVNRYAADEYYRRALIAFSRRDFDKAIANLNDAIEEVPRHPDYYAARGLVHLEEAEYDEAEADFAEAVRLNKYDVLGNYGLGFVALKKKNYETAKAYLLQAYYAQPKRPETLFSLAVACYYLGDLANAANYMGQVHAIFEAANDKRKADSTRWLKELSKHVARPARPAGTLPSASQPRLPLGDG
jgi:Tfp pilus assembly protein PilF